MRAKGLVRAEAYHRLRESKVTKVEVPCREPDVPGVEEDPSRESGELGPGVGGRARCSLEGGSTPKDLHRIVESGGAAGSPSSGATSTEAGAADRLE
jgi:hypothetical protein